MKTKDETIEIDKDKQNLNMYCNRLNNKGMINKLI